MTSINFEKLRNKGKPTEDVRSGAGVPPILTQQLPAAAIEEIYEKCKGIDNGYDWAALGKRVDSWYGTVLKARQEMKGRQNDNK